MAKSEVSQGDGMVIGAQPFLTGEHEKALHTLQSEIDYHQRHDENATYVEKLFSTFSSGTSDSLHQLELVYKIESDHPNSLSREQVIQAVTSDQRAMASHDRSTEFATNVSNFGMVVLGGKWGAVAAATTFALDTMHPHDSFGQQALEGVAGFVTGTWAGKLTSSAFQLQSPIAAGVLAAAPFLGLRALAHGSWPNEGYGQAPDPYKMMGMPVVVIKEPQPSIEQSMALMAKAGSMEWRTNRLHFLAKE